MLNIVKRGGLSLAVLLSVSTATAALAGDIDRVAILTDTPSAADGLKARLVAAGYDVMITENVSDLQTGLDTYKQVWDVRMFAALSDTETTNYLNYLNGAGGLFLLGENSSFETRNSSLVSFLGAAGAGDVTYGGMTVAGQYVTAPFNGDALIVPDTATSFYVPASGTFATAGSGIFISTTGPDGTGQGTGIAFGAGALANAPSGRLLTYLDVNTFQAQFYEATPALRALIDRMIGFVAGDFQVPVPGASVIDASQPSFDLTDPAATGDTIVFNGGTLDIVGGSDPANRVTADVSIGSGGAFINTAGVSSTFSGTISGDAGGDGGLNVSGGGTLTLTGSNSYAGGTVISGGSTVAVAGQDALGTGGIVLAGGTLQAMGALALAAPVTLMSGTNQIDTGANQVVVNGAIGGTGGLIKTGTGTLTLTGPNAYTGGTVVQAGTLVGDTGSLGGAIANAGTVEFAQTGNGSFSGTISGTGMLVKSGTGTLTLTGPNAYTGGTVVQAGTLVGDTGSLVGAIANAGTVEFAQTGNGSFSGAISGTGALVKSGTGTLTLTGANSHEGGTVVTGGTLVASATTLAGPVQNDAAFVLNQLVDGTFASVVSGTGTLVKQGEGRLNLTGTSTYSGATTVEDGRLAVNGSIANSVVTVQQGGSIGGNGTVGGLIVRTNATAAPGNSIGQLRAATTVLFEPNSIYEVEVDATGASDRIVASGVATLQGGTVAVLAEAGTYRPQTSYQILAAARVDGTFADVTTNLAFLTPTLRYAADSVTLVLTRNDIRFADVAATRNQRATATALNAAFGATSAVYNELVGLSAEEARTSFDRMSGEVHASALSVAADQAEALRRSLLGRFDAAPAAGPTLWMEASGGWIRLDRTRESAKVAGDSRGFRGGLEIGFGPARIGVAGGYEDGDLSLGGRAAGADLKATHAAVYGGVALGRLGIRAGATHSWFDLDTHRTAAAGAIAQELTAKYDARAIQAFGEAGYRLPVGLGSVEPFVGVHALWVKNDAFAERGGSLALNGADASRDYAWTTLGAKGAFPLGAGSPIHADVQVAWQHALTDRDMRSTLAFGSGSGFAIEGAPRAKNAGTLDLGLGWALTGAARVRVGYSGALADQSATHAAKASVSIGF